MMGVDKQKARRQRNIHLSVDCGNAADMSRDLVYVNRLLSFVRSRTEKTTATKTARKKRLVVLEGSRRKRQREQKLNSTETQRKHHVPGT